MNEDKMKLQERFFNYLFVRSIKQNREALEVLRILKQNFVYFIRNVDSFELVQEKVLSVAKNRNNLLKKMTLKHLSLALTQQIESVSRGDSIDEILESLEANLSVSLEVNEINSFWVLAGQVSLSNLKVTQLKVEYEKRKL